MKDRAIKVAIWALAILVIFWVGIAFIKTQEINCPPGSVPTRRQDSFYWACAVTVPPLKAK